jgi:hypothetical protein
VSCTSNAVADFVAAAAFRQLSRSRAGSPQTSRNHSHCGLAVSDMTLKGSETISHVFPVRRLGCVTDYSKTSALFHSFGFTIQAHPRRGLFGTPATRSSSSCGTFARDLVFCVCLRAGRTNSSRFLTSRRYILRFCITRRQICEHTPSRYLFRRWRLRRFMKHP